MHVRVLLNLSLWIYAVKGIFCAMAVQSRHEIFPNFKRWKKIPIRFSFCIQYKRCHVQFLCISPCFATIFFFFFLHLYIDNQYPPFSIFRYDLDTHWKFSSSLVESRYHLQGIKPWIKRDLKHAFLNLRLSPHNAANSGRTFYAKVPQ